MVLSTIANASRGSDFRGHLGPYLKPTLVTYYADASDAGPTDSGANWTDDSNAFNGNTGNYAFSTTQNGVLTAEGTTAPTTAPGGAGDILAVRVRANTQGDPGSVVWKMETREDSTSGTILNYYQGAAQITQGWEKWFQIAAPSAGWTWQKINDLAFRFWVDESSVDDLRIFSIEIDVAYYDGTETDLYMVAEDSGTTDKVGVFKSTDGGANWTRQDTSNAPTISPSLAALASVMNGGDFHILASEGVSGSGMSLATNARWIRFDSATDTYVDGNDLENVSIDISGNQVRHEGGGLAVRDTTEVVVVTQMDDRTDMGNDFAQFGVWVRESEATVDPSVRDLNGPTPLNAANENQTNADVVMAPGDEAHIGYVVAATADAYQTTMDQAGSLSTRVQGFTVGSLSSVTRPVTFDVSGTQKVLFSTETAGRVRRLEEDGSGDMALEAGQAETVPFASGGGTNGVAYDPVDGDAYFFGSSTDLDLFYDVAADGDDANWGTDTEVEDGISVTLHGVFVQYYERDGGRQIGYIVIDSGTLKYNELEIEAPPADGPVFPPFLHRPPRHVRM